MGGVLLAGDLGARDPGDDALLAAFARGLPRRNLVLMSGDPRRASRRHGRPAVSVRDRRRLIAALRHCQVLVLGDGALRGSRGGERTRDVLAITLAAKALGRKVALLGVGVGQLERRTDRMRVAALVRLADLLVLRDRSSAQTLADAGAPGPFRVAADPTWCALPDAPATAERNPEALVILDSRCTRADSPSRLAPVLERVAAAGLRIRLAPWRISRYGADDLELARTVAAWMRARAQILLPPASLDEARFQAARASVVLASRVQALIVAASAGTPAVALGGDLELASLAVRLGQPAPTLDAGPEPVVDALIKASQGPPPSAAAVRAERATADEAFRLLRLLLDAERSDEDHDVVALPLAPVPTDRDEVDQ